MSFLNPKMSSWTPRQLLKLTLRSSPWNSDSITGSYRHTFLPEVPSFLRLFDSPAISFSFLRDFLTRFVTTIWEFNTFFVYLPRLVQRPQSPQPQTKPMERTFTTTNNLVPYVLFFLWQISTVVLKSHSVKVILCGYSVSPPHPINWWVVTDLEFSLQSRPYFHSVFVRSCRFLVQMYVTLIVIVLYWYIMTSYYFKFRLFFFWSFHLNLVRTSLYTL